VNDDTTDSASIPAKLRGYANHEYLPPLTKPHHPLAWDYSTLASTYDGRPDYAPGFIGSALAQFGVPRDALALDIGAGTGKLTVELRRYGLDVLALEPNVAMRDLGRSKLATGVRWLAAYGQALPLRDACADVAAYGSSFNVLPPTPALDEAARCLRASGCWLAIWNHRDLSDPLQREIEAVVCDAVPDYDAGSRRGSPADTLAGHGAFAQIVALEQAFVARCATTDWLSAWASHATLRRQAGDRFTGIVARINALVGDRPTLDIPYTSRAWLARRRP